MLGHSAATSPISSKLKTPWGSRTETSDELFSLAVARGCGSLPPAVLADSLHVAGGMNERNGGETAAAVVFVHLFTVTVGS